MVGILAGAAFSRGPCSLGDCCAASDSVGGQVKLVSPVRGHYSFASRRRARFEKAVNRSSLSNLLPFVYAGSR